MTRGRKKDIDNQEKAAYNVCESPAAFPYDRGKVSRACILGERLLQMRYWLTVQWPPYQDERYRFRLRVWLRSNKEWAGRDLRSGDPVLVYQTISGRAIIHSHEDGRRERIRCVWGHSGIIAVAEAAGPIKRDPQWPVWEYEDGRNRCWGCQASLTLVSSDGFVPRVQVNRILGYSPRYTMRGFGAGTGLKEITKGQYQELVAAFESRA